jgi:hypothetical protein
VTHGGSPESVAGASVPDMGILAQKTTGNSEITELDFSRIFGGSVVK